MHQSSFSSLPEFERWLMRKLESEFHDFFVVVDCESEEVIGFTYSYEFHPFDGHCKMTCCVFDEFVDTGVGAVAGLLMADYLFRCYPLRQIYTAVYSYNERSIRIHSKTSHGWKEVAIYEGYRFLGGVYHDLHVYCMTREVFYRKYAGTVNRLRGKE